MKITIDTERKILKIDTCLLSYREAEIELNKLFNGDSWKEYKMESPPQIATINTGNWGNGLIGHFDSNQQISLSNNP